MTPRPPFRPALWNQIVRAIYQQGVAYSVIEVAQKKWEAGLQVSDIRCREEGRGKPYGLESGCICRGCQQRRCFAFFDQVRQMFGPGA